MSEQLLSTSLEWLRWTRDVMPRLVRQRAITREEGLMLKELGSRADRSGGCFASAVTLGEGIGVGGRQAERLLCGLRAKGLVSSVPRGRGCVRTLQPAAVPDLLTGQLSFDDLLDGLLAEPVCDAPPAPAPAVGAVVVVAGPPTSASGPPTSRCRTKEVKAFKEGEGAPARDPDRVGVLQPHLDEVLDVLNGAPGLMIEPLAVNSALAAFPEASGYTHLSAAHTVSSWAHEGGLRITSANRQLMAALRRQIRPASAQRAPWTPAHDGRARRAAPAPAGTPSYTRED